MMRERLQAMLSRTDSDIEPHRLEEILVDMSAPRVDHLGIGTDKVTYVHERYKVFFTVHSEHGDAVTVTVYDGKGKTKSSTIPKLPSEQDSWLDIGLRAIYNKFVAPQIKENYQKIRESRRAAYEHLPALVE